MAKRNFMKVARHVYSKDKQTFRGGGAGDFTPGRVRVLFAGILKLAQSIAPVLQKTMPSRLYCGQV